MKVFITCAMTDFRHLTEDDKETELQELGYIYESTRRRLKEGIPFQLKVTTLPPRRREDDHTGK